ncbi:MAG: glycosyltransferase family 2 protein [Candidatus Babeliales bacterium]
MNLKLFFGLIFVGGVYTIAAAYQHDIVVIIPSYKNQDVCNENLASVLMQDYEKFRVVYIDDCSPDNTYANAKAFIDQYDIHHRVTLIKNEIRGLALRNIVYAFYKFCKPHEIAVILDGDDTFTTKDVLSSINEQFSDESIWFTYGNFWGTRNGYAPWSGDIPPMVKQRNLIRQNWYFSPPRCMYAWLFREVALKDLLHEGMFFSMAQDVSWVYPIIEMAINHYKFNPNILYRYNEDNPIADGATNWEKQQFLRKVISSRSAYKPLEQRPYRESYQKKSIPFLIYANDPNTLAETLSAFKGLYKNENLNVICCGDLSHKNDYEQLASLYSHYTFVINPSQDASPDFWLKDVNYDYYCVITDVKALETLKNREICAEAMHDTKSNFCILSKKDFSSQQNASYLWDGLAISQVKFMSPADSCGMIVKRNTVLSLSTIQSYDLSKDKEDICLISCTE